MKVREYTNIQNYIDSRATKLLEKKDLLQMEQMIKNMEMKGRKPNAAGGLAGQLKL